MKFLKKLFYRAQIRMHLAEMDAARESLANLPDQEIRDRELAHEICRQKEEQARKERDDRLAEIPLIVKQRKADLVLSIHTHRKDAEAYRLKLVQLDDNQSVEAIAQ